MDTTIVSDIIKGGEESQSINVCYAFIGNLPSYTIEQAHQLRLFYDGPAYFILNDYENPIVKILQDKYKIIIIRYEDVIHNDFVKLIKRTYKKFCIVHGLKGREKLFIYSFERFYVLYNLIVKHSLQNIIFLEIDNLIYDDPRNWLNALKNVDVAYMFDNYNRASAGVSYFKNHAILADLLEHFNVFIENHNGFIDEMSALYSFYELMDKKKEGKCMAFLPIHWSDPKKPPQSYDLSKEFNNSIFDASSIGIYLAGFDPVHTRGKTIIGKKNPRALIDYTKYKYEDIYDDKGRKIPYILHDGVLTRINNLHIHSKSLVSQLSAPL
jgi:hypothetical protein